MMRNPVHSRYCPSNAPNPHRNELPGAENSGSENTSPTVEKALMLKSPPMKSTLCCSMYPCSRHRRSVEASRFLATTLWMCTVQNVTVGVPESEGRRSRPQTMSRTIYRSQMTAVDARKRAPRQGCATHLLRRRERSRKTWWWRKKYGSGVGAGNFIGSSCGSSKLDTPNYWSS